MEDPEEKKSFTGSEITTLPLKICSSTIRITKNTLSMQDLIKTTLCIISLQFICTLAMTLSRGGKTTYSWVVVCQMLPQLGLYIFMYANLFSGGWGAPDSRFWCDVKIMYVRGFNTIRTISRMVSFSINLWLMAIVLQINNTTTMALLPLLAIVSEWQAGLSENKNQYDIKAFDKFTKDDDQTLCLESLNYFQSQKNEQGKLTTSFIVNCLMKTYIITCLLVTWPYTETEMTFGIPIIVTSVLYTFIVPVILDLVYIKSGLTFCQVELYRMIMDIILPFVIVLFSLV